MSEEDHIRDTYAHFGLALYFAQVLEHGLVNAMVIARLPESRSISRSEIDAFMDRQFEKTLGMLLRELAKYVHVPEGLSTGLQDALSKRNWLAHDYFRERATTFLTEHGRNSMVKELQAARELFKKVDSQLAEIMRPVREQFGLTDEAIAREYEALHQESRLDG